MPTVPRYGSQQVAPQALPGVRVNPATSTHTPLNIVDNTGVQTAQSLSSTLNQVGSTLLQVQRREEAQANQVRVNDAMNQAVEAKLNLTYGQAGYINFKGKEALERPDGMSLRDEYTQQLDDQLKAISDSLGNEDQRRQFNLQASQLSVQFGGGVAQHTAREYETYQVSVQDGTIKTAQQQMGLAWGDPAMLAQSKEAISAASYEMGKLRGWSGQEVEAYTTAQLSMGHSTVIAEAANAGNIGYAKEYYSQNREQMSADARLRAEKVLEVGDFEQTTQDAAGKLYAENKGDIGAALTKAREQYKGKEEDAIVQRLKGLDAERVQLRERAQNDAADSAWRIYAQSGTLARIPPTTLAAMDGKQLEALRRTARADQEAALAKQQVKTDPNIYYALATMAGAAPEQFKQQDLRNFFDKLSPGDREHFINLQTKAQKPQETDQVVTVGAQKNAMVQTLGLKKEAAGLFHQQADKALFAAQQEKGKPLNQDERQKVLDKLVVQGEIQYGSFFRADPNVRYYEAVSRGEAEKFRAEFSDADRTKATAALQRRGIKNPTKQQIDAVLQQAYGLNPQ